MTEFHDDLDRRSFEERLAATPDAAPAWFFALVCLVLLAALAGVVAWLM